MADSFTEEAPYESRELQNPSVIEAFAKGVMSFGYEAVRKFLRKKSNTLYAEMNPYGDQKKAKLSVDDAIEATKITQDATWLAIAASELGFRLTPTRCEPVSEDTAYPALSRAVSTLGELASAIQRDMSDNKLTKREKLELFSKATEAHAALGPFLVLENDPSAKGRQLNRSLP